eukprot:4949349-Prymnesium_polylepis.1
MVSSAFASGCLNIQTTARHRATHVTNCDLKASIPELKLAAKSALQHLSRSANGSQSTSSPRGSWCSGFNPCAVGKGGSGSSLLPAPTNGSRPALFYYRSSHVEHIEHLQGSPGKWELQNACVAYHECHSRSPCASPVRNHTEVQFISREDVFAYIQGYSEGDSFGTIATVRPQGHASELMECEQQSTGLAVTSSSLDALSQIDSGAVILPLGDSWLRDLWMITPPNSTSAEAFRDRRNQAERSSSSLRMIISRSFQHLLRSPCVCFERVHGDTGTYGPGVTIA